MTPAHNQPSDTNNGHTSDKKANDDQVNAAPQQGLDADLAAAAAQFTGEKSLEDKVQELEAEIAKLRDQWIRAAAETDNVRKRAQRDIEESSKYAVTNFARDMIDVIENLRRASDSIPAGVRQTNDVLRTLGEGVDLTLQELLGIFQKYGIMRIDPLNQKFDHNLHQAVVQIDNNDVPPGTVVQVVQAGYIIQDRLLRPAMVAVSKRGETTGKIDTTA
jgi:molecular chaperone GrpE